MTEHNELVSLSENLSDTYRTKASDFPAPKGSGPKGEAQGKDTLVSLSTAQESPRTLESVSEDGPSEWGKGGTAFKVGKAADRGTSPELPVSVDLVSGKISCKGYKQTVQDEVEGPYISIGK